MMSRLPIGKILGLVVLMVFGLLYSVPNLYIDQPAVQISARGDAKITPTTISTVQSSIQKIAHQPIEQTKDRLLVRFADANLQMQAKEAIMNRLGDDYIVALNLATSTPNWMRSLGAMPMKLGLDLRGGVHFLLDVDTDAVVKARIEGDLRTLKVEMRKAKIRYKGLASVGSNGLKIRLKNQEALDQAESLIKRQFSDYTILKHPLENNTIGIQFSREAKRKIIDFAVAQTMTILSKRVNELGVSEAVVQRQGERHISVDLPGIQDTARAKNLLGKTATLKMMIVDDAGNVNQAINGKIPTGSQLLYDLEGVTPYLLKDRVILSGSSITYASSVVRDSGPAVNIHLGGGGESLFHRTTSQSIGKRMAVVYVETRMIEKMHNGKKSILHKRREYVISAPTIQSALGNNFDITGLHDPKYARNLALLLRSGALAAPISIIEELTVGPSLGKANIHKGLMSICVGTLLVILFMLAYYRLFGLIANLALFFNILLVVAILSILGATLTLPGIAAIVLTVGMAVDSNVLINERIREEIRNGMTPLASIRAGYDRAFATIVDANVTTLIVALVLFGLGSGAVKGFAVSLVIGLLASMITAVFFTRVIIELIYGGRKGLTSLSIGGNE